MITALLLAMANPPAPPIVVMPRSSPDRALLPSETLPSDFAAVPEFMGGLFTGQLDRALTFVADDVEIAVSDGTRTIQTFPRNKAVARAMYLSMTNRGALAINNFSCRPEGALARCDVILGQGDQTRDFTLRFAAEGGPITRILSWENHGADAPPAGGNR